MSECACRCDWCRDRRYYLAGHLPTPPLLDPRPRDPEEEARRHGGKECMNRFPCRCHCPSCHHREAHYVHFHLFRLDWDCPSLAADWAGGHGHYHNDACRPLPWIPGDGSRSQAALRGAL